MPHVIVKLWPGKSDAQKQALADGITQLVMTTLGYNADAVSVALEEVAPDDWTETVYRHDIVDGPGILYKKPGYDPT